MAAETTERKPQAGDMARGWGALIGLVAVVLGLVGFLLPEDSAASGVALWLAGAALLVALGLVVVGVIARVVVPTRR